MDEYTSTVDRTVAQVGSAALARTVRELGRRFVAITCHEDVEAWLQPDWTYRPATASFAWRRLRRRPAIRLRIYRSALEAWALFRPHHYLSADLSHTAQAFIALWRGQPVAFSAWVNALVKGGGKREHRTVTLPDYQGLGIGHALSDFCASLWAGLGYRVWSRTSHPAFVAARSRSPNWRLIRPPSLGNRSGWLVRALPHARTRLTAGFEYVGPALDAATACVLLSRD
jgi:GNAT superfamily N-acetyltransferase